MRLLSGLASSQNSEILERIQKAKPQLSREEIIELRQKVTVRCLIEFNRAMGFAPDDADEIERRVFALKPILEPIPVEAIYDSYLYAIQNRKSTLPLNGTEWVEAWYSLKRGATLTIADTKENRIQSNSGICFRCNNSGREFYVDDNKRPGYRGCDHQSRSEDEIADSEAARQEFFENHLRNAKSHEENNRALNNVTQLKND